MIAKILGMVSQNLKHGVGGILLEIKSWKNEGERADGWEGEKE